MNKVGEIGPGHYICLVRLAKASGWGVGKTGENPHTTERNAGPETRGRFSNKASATGPKNPEDLPDNRLAVRNDEEQPRYHDSVHLAEALGQVLGVAAMKLTVGQTPARSAALCAGQKIVGQIDTRRAKLGKFIREATGVKTGTTAYLQNMGSSRRGHR